jgi:hypothetical protein
VTVKVVEPLIAPEVAWIVVVPCATLVAKPAALIVAIFVADELHVAIAVRFCVLLSLYLPVAVNCCVLPIGIERLAGVTAIETSEGGVTDRLVVPLTAFKAAWIAAVPCATLEASP